MNNRIFRKLLAVSLGLSWLLASAVTAQEQPAAQLMSLLPPLSPPVTVQAATAPETGSTWQIHQRLDVTPGSWQTSLSLNPSLNLVLHDPQAGPAAEAAAREQELRVLDRVSLQAGQALSVHQNVLDLQRAIWLNMWLQEWLVLWHDLAASAPAQPARSLTQFLQAERLLHETADSIELLLLTLAAAGIDTAELASAAGMSQSQSPVTDPATALPGVVPEREPVWFRPHVEVPAEPLAACLNGSLELRQLELLQDLHHLDEVRETAGRQQRVELELGASVTVSGHSSPDLGWNIGLRMNRADYSGPQLRLDASPGSISQSLTIRPGVPEPESPQQDLSASYDREAIRLVEILQLVRQSGQAEDHMRQAAHSDTQLLLDQLQQGSASVADLETSLDSTLDFVQAARYRDYLLLTLAAECRLPHGYLESPVYP